MGALLFKWKHYPLSTYGCEKLVKMQPRFAGIYICIYIIFAKSRNTKLVHPVKAVFA